MANIHPAFTDWLASVMDEYAMSATLMLGPSLPSAELYELLVPDAALRDTLQAAAINMSSVQSINTRVQLHSNLPTFGGNLNFELVMPVPQGWNTILFPRTSKRVMIGGHYPKLTELLMPSLRVAQEWVTLKHVVTGLLSIANDRNAIRDMFPWIVDAINEGEWRDKNRQFFTYRGIKSKVERDKVDATFRAALTLKHGNVPLMTPDIRKVCLSGTRLFSQIRMLKASDEGTFERMQWRATSNAALTPVLSGELIPENITNDMQSIMDYKNGQA